MGMRTGAQKVLIFQGLTALTEKEAPNAGANCNVSSGNAGAAEKLNECETCYCSIEKRPCHRMQGRLFHAF